MLVFLGGETLSPDCLAFVSLLLQVASMTGDLIQIMKGPPGPQGTAATSLPLVWPMELSIVSDFQAHLEKQEQSCPQLLPAFVEAG